uniref:Uncharacterized protein n=1 Tax=Caenorhabditis japonica TaxID=281687 RepID=A0A8R1ITK5_CAEJA
TASRKEISVIAVITKAGGIPTWHTIEITTLFAQSYTQTATNTVTNFNFEIIKANARGNWIITSNNARRIFVTLKTDV